MANNIKLITKEYVDTELSTKANKVISDISYESFIDTYRLKEPEWVDLSFIGGEYYYTDLSVAITDINNGNTASASSDKTGAVCQIFTDGNITVLRLLNNIIITSNITFTKSIIVDLNGYTITLDNAIIDQSTENNNLSIIFYGIKTNSKIIRTRIQDSEVDSAMLYMNIGYFGVFGGTYTYTNNTDSIGVLLHLYLTSKTDMYNANFNMLSTFNITGAKRNLCFVHSAAEVQKFPLPECNVTNCNFTTNLVSGIATGLQCTEDINYNFKDTNITSTVQKNNTTDRRYAIALQIVLNSRIASNTIPLGTFNMVGGKISAISPDNGDNSAGGISNYAQLRLDGVEVTGITSGISNHGILYMKNCKCSSPYHGGVYNALISALKTTYNSTLYAENTEFHRSALPEGYTATGWGAAYFGYGSVSYVNNCKFILDTEDSISKGIVVRETGTPIGKQTVAYVSNSEIPSLRCDSNQVIYLGNGISDDIKNTTVDGIKHLTQFNYITVDDKEAYSLMNPTALFDNELSTTSENPVQNKVIAAKLNDKQDYFADVSTDNTEEWKLTIYDPAYYPEQKQEMFTILANHNTQGLNIPVSLYPRDNDAISQTYLNLKLNDYTKTADLESLLEQNFVHNLQIPWGAPGVYVSYTYGGNELYPIINNKSDISYTQGTPDEFIPTVKFVDDSITAQVSSVYKAKGSLENISSLPTASKDTEGFVYNIENEFTTTEDFVEGAGKTYPVGTNVVIVSVSDTVYKYDVLAGMVDLTNYVTSNTLNTSLDTKLDKVTTTDEYIRIYIVTASGNQGVLKLASGSTPVARYIPRYSANGTLVTYAPKTNFDAANKAYVDNLVGDINTILATLVDISSTTQDEQSTEESIITDKPSVKGELS